MYGVIPAVLVRERCHGFFIRGTGVTASPTSPSPVAITERDIPVYDAPAARDTANKRRQACGENGTDMRPVTATKIRTTRLCPSFLNAAEIQYLCKNTSLNV